MSDLAAWLRSEADRHMVSIAARDEKVVEHAIQLRQWAMLVDAHRDATEVLVGISDATERWNIAVEKILGRQLESGIDVAKARAAIFRVRSFA
jgi:hypothetical protein